MKVVNVDRLIEVLRKNNIPFIGKIHRLILQLAFDVPENSEKNSQLDMTNVWYEVPHIVSYITDAAESSIGIVYHEFLIDLMTGRAYTCQEVLRKGLELGFDLDFIIIESDNWANFSINFQS